ncbi:hypothetical protein D3C72_564190 [compost metagenome]
MGHSQIASPTRGRNRPLTMKAVRYRLAKWLAMSAPSRWAAQNRAMAASSQLKLATWARVMTDRARA